MKCSHSSGICDELSPGQTNAVWGFYLLGVAIKENPKRDGLGTISTLGVKTAFVGVGDGGAVSQPADSRSKRASPGRLWINVTLDELSNSRLYFYHLPKSELTRALTLRLDEPREAYKCLATRI